MEDMIRSGLLVGVIDYTLSELANSLMRGIHATPADRLTVAPQHRLPLLVVPGAGDFFNQGPLDTVPERYRTRALYNHNPVATLVRMNADEMRSLGEMIADRLRGATAPTEVLVPTAGLSLIGVPAGPIADAEADGALVTSLREHLPASIPLLVRDGGINDEAFATEVAEEFMRLLSQSAST